MKLIKFYSPTCVPCKAITPIVTKFAEDYNLDYEEIDANDNDDMVLKYKVRSVPTIVLLNGIKEYKLVGMHTYDQLLDALKSIM